MTFLEHSQPPERDTDPAPAPEDDGSTLHTMTLTGALATIAVLKEQRAELLRNNRQLETELAQLRAERR